ncbi:alginate export family protein [Methylorubrum populi]
MVLTRLPQVRTEVVLKQSLLSVALIAALCPVAAQAQLRPQSQVEAQAVGGQGHAQALENGRTKTRARRAKPRPRPQTEATPTPPAPVLPAKGPTWPYFQGAPKGAPAFSLYEALGRPDNFKINGTFRPRIEGINNQFRPVPPNARDDILASFLGTLFVEYDAGPVRFGGELFDSRGYFQRRNSTAAATEINALEIGQLYLDADLSAFTGEGSKSSITAGRQTKNVGSRRLISRQQFRNTINAYTGVSFDWQGANKDRMTLLWFMPHTRLPGDVPGLLDNEIVWDRESLDLQLFGGSYTFANVFGGTFEVYGYGLYEQDAPGFQTRNRRLFTPGARLARAPKPGQFDWDFEGIYQTGLARDTAAITDTRDLDVSAFFVHGEVGYTFDRTWLPRVVLQYDQASGDGSNPNTYNRFDTLFGARRFEYGPTGLYGPIQRANLISPAVRFEVTPSRTWDMFIAYRPFWLDSPTDSAAFTGVRDRTGRSGTFAGQQIEARLRYWLVPDTMLLDTGAAYLIKGDFLRNAPNAPDTGNTFYGYLNTTIFF